MLLYDKVVPKKFYGLMQAQGKSAGSGGSGDDPDVLTWIAAVGSSNVSAPRKAMLNTFVGALKSAGVWTTIDRYWLLAGENIQSASIDLKSVQSLTVIGSPVFTANQGIVTSNGPNNIDTNFVPKTSGVNVTLNSATYGCFINTDHPAPGGGEFGAADGPYTEVVQMIVWGSGIVGDKYSECRLHSSGIFYGDTSRTNLRGSWIMSRTPAPAGSVALYDNGSSAPFPNGGMSGIVAVTNLPAFPIAIGAVNLGGAVANWSGSQVSSFVAAGGWTAAQALAFYNAERALMTSVGLA